MDIVNTLKKIAIQLLPTKKISFNGTDFETIEDYYLYFFSTNSIFFIKKLDLFFKPCFFAKKNVDFLDRLTHIFKNHFYDYKYFTQIRELPIYLENIYERDVDMFCNKIEKMEHQKKYELIKKMFSHCQIFEKNHITLWDKNIELFANKMCLFFLNEEFASLVSLFFFWFCLHVIQKTYFNNVGSIRNKSLSNDISTYLLSTLLLKTSIIVKTNIKSASIAGINMFGIVSENCSGKRIKDLETGLKLSDKSIIQLNTMWVFDVICQQRDHGINNINVTINNNVITSCCAFDNDYPLSFLPFNKISINKTLKEMVENGIKVDLDFINALSNVSFQEINNLLKNHLTRVQIRCLFKRIKRVGLLFNKYRNSESQVSSINCPNVQYLLNSMIAHY